MKLFLMLVFLVSCSCLHSENTLFELLSNTDVIQQHTESIPSITFLRCSMLCTIGTCSAVVYDHGSSECKKYNEPQAVLEASTKPRENVDALFLRPCQKVPSTCLNGGECVTNKTILRGYSCNCTEDWIGYNCQQNKNRCPWDGFTIEQNTCYYHSSPTNTATYLGAKEKCMERESTLASASNSTTWNNFRTIALREDDWFIVGLQKTNNTWKWLDGSSDFISWKLPWEPSGDGSCASIFPDGNGLNDQPCSFSRRYLCEKEPVY